MGLESHVNEVLYRAGFKPSSWYWQFGDLIALNAPTARRIAVALNKSGEFGTARIDTGRHAVVIGKYRGPAKHGGKRRSGGTAGKGRGGPFYQGEPGYCPKCGAPSTVIARGWGGWDEDRECENGHRFSVSFTSSNDPGTVATGGGGKRRRAATAAKPSGSLGAVVADINRLTK
jgi:hypothetical protein